MKEWLVYKKTRIGHSGIIPSGEKKTQPVEPDWLERLWKWGVKEEIEAHDGNYKNATRPRTEYTYVTRDCGIKASGYIPKDPPYAEEGSRLRKTEPQKRITYARKPIIDIACKKYNTKKNKTETTGAKTEQ